MLLLTPTMLGSLLAGVAMWLMFWYGVNHVDSRGPDSILITWAEGAPTASKLISEDSGLNDTELQSLVTNDERVKQLQDAYPNEVLFADDVRSGNTRNSYQSLHPIPPPPPAPSSIAVNDSAPSISNLTSVVGSTSTTMTWTTDKPATSQLLFGSSTAMGENATPDMDLVTNHARSISGLASGTTYYYEAQSKDASGTIGTSGQQSFTTLGQ